MQGKKQGLDEIARVSARHNNATTFILLQLLFPDKGRALSLSCRFCIIMKVGETWKKLHDTDPSTIFLFIRTPERMRK